MRLSYILAAACSLLVAAPAIAQQQAPIYKDRNGNFQGAQGVMVINTTDPVQAQKTQGTAANGDPTNANPVLVAGTDGTTTRTLRLSSSGIVTLGVQTNVTDVPFGQLALTIGSNGQASTLGVLNYLYDGVQQRYMRGDTTGLYVVSKGAGNLATTQVSVGTTATLIAAARPGRARLMITQSAAGPCYYGPTNAVSATTGSRLTVAGASKTYEYSGALYGVCPSGAVTTDADEEY